MTPAELKARTERFADAIVALCAPLLDKPRTRELADQLLRSGTALDSNYGSAQRARSNREFVSKLGQALDDASESLGWLRRLSGLKPSVSPELPTLLREADELTRILASSCATAKRNREARDPRRRKASRPISDRDDRNDEPINRSTD